MLLRHHRNVQFSRGSCMDLMAVAEHEDFVHVVDARRWDLVQHVAVSGDSSNDIAGLCFDPRVGRLCYTGVGIGNFWRCSFFLS